MKCSVSSNNRTTSVQRALPPVVKVDPATICGCDEPETHVDQIDPDRVLHPPNSAIAFGVQVDVHAAEDAENRSPEDAGARQSVPCGCFYAGTATHKRTASHMKNIQLFIKGIMKMRHVMADRPAMTSA